MCKCLSVSVYEELQSCKCLRVFVCECLARFTIVTSFTFVCVCFICHAYIFLALVCCKQCPESRRKYIARLTFLNHATSHKTGAKFSHVCQLEQFCIGVLFIYLFFKPIEYHLIVSLLNTTRTTHTLKNIYTYPFSDVFRSQIFFFFIFGDNTQHPHPQK